MRSSLFGNSCNMLKGLESSCPKKVCLRYNFYEGRKEVDEVSDNFKVNFVCNKAIVGVAKGNIDALSDIYDSIGKQIYFIAYSVLKNHHDAEDVLQEVLCEIVKCAHTYKPMSNARAWILSIARNQALKYRRDKKTHLSFDDLENDIQLSYDISFISNLTLFDALRSLSDDEKQVVMLHVESGLKFREISDLMGITSEAAQKRYQRAIKKLKAYYS